MLIYNENEYEYACIIWARVYLSLSHNRKELDAIGVVKHTKMKMNMNTYIHLCMCICINIYDMVVVCISLCLSK